MIQVHDTDKKHPVAVSPQTKTRKQFLCEMNNAFMGKI